MMNKLRSILLLQALLFSVLALTAPQIFAAPMDRNFDHYNTNFPLDGAHKRAKCDSCHKRGIFKGTPKTCQTCHGSNSKIASSTMPTTHVRVTGTCDTCHMEKNWGQVRMDHSAVTGICKSCHDGAHKGITGRSARHFQTNAACDDCHNSRNWTSTKFKHDGSQTNCISCHIQGGIASSTSMNAQHPQIIGNDCEQCHNQTKRFTPITKSDMDHSALAPASADKCALCHDFSNVTAPSFHMLGMSNYEGNCNECHNDRGWSGAPMKHELAKPDSCSVCHGSSAGDVPSKGRKVTSAVDHSSILANSIKSACQDCHKGGVSGRGGSWSGVQMKAIGAHDSPPLKSGSISCQTCHTTGNRLKTTTVRSSQHFTAITSNLCVNCHGGSALGKSFIQVRASDVHNGTSKQCGTCHDSTSNYPRSVKAINKKTSNHSIITNQTNCDSCHSDTSRTFTKLVKSGAHGTGKTCQTCHATTIAYPTRTGWSSNSIKSGGHFTTAITNCESCHSTRSTFVNTNYSHTGIFPSNTGNHNPKRCKSCHTTNSQNNVGRESNPSLTPLCGGCHGTRYANENPGSHLNAPLASMADCTAACHKPAGEHSTSRF